MNPVLIQIEILLLKLASADPGVQEGCHLKPEDKQSIVPPSKLNELNRSATGVPWPSGG